MSTILSALVITAILLFTLLAYGRTRWVGKKLQRSVFLAYWLNSLSFIGGFLFYFWQTASIWRIMLLGIVIVLWIATSFWSWCLERAQKKLSGDLSGQQSA